MSHPAAGYTPAAGCLGACALGPGWGVEVNFALLAHGEALRYIHIKYHYASGTLFIMSVTSPKIPILWRTPVWGQVARKYTLLRYLEVYCA